MTAYATSNTKNATLNPVLPIALWPGDEAYVFGTTPIVPGQSQKPNDSNVAFETVALNERSIAVTLAMRPGGGAAPGVEVRVFANANPGAAEIDVCISNVDADGAYTVPSGSASYKITVWTQEGNQWVGGADLQPVGSSFLTLLVVANPNAVAYTAKVTYV